MQESVIAGLLDELEKISASTQMAGYMQSRRGTRPYRVSTLLAKDQARPHVSEPNLLVQNPENDQAQPAEPDTGEEDAQSLGKIAGKLSESNEKALGAFAKARPYVSSAAQSAVPAALLGGVYGGKRTAKVFGTVGAGAGVLNQALKNWAEKNKRKRVAKEILGD